jgi:hypothetical protein
MFLDFFDSNSIFLFCFLGKSRFLPPPPENFLPSSPGKKSANAHVQLFSFLHFSTVPATTFDEAPEAVATAGEVEVVSEDVKVIL